MKSLLNAKTGFTLIEVSIGICILMLVWVAAAGAMVVNSYAASYSKHKVQAIYVAQRILEEQRRQPFTNIVSQPSARVSIDTRGTFGVTTDDFLGNRIITVSAIDAYRKRVRVEINWNERLAGTTRTLREYCATDIANEPQLN